MKNNINIKYNGQVFSYMLEYEKNISDSHNVNDYIYNSDITLYDDNSILRLYNNINYYKDTNNWYHIDNLESKIEDNYIPELIKTSCLKLYIPNHTPSTYIRGIKYALNINTWLNGYKIDLGTYMFEPSDTIAIPSGTLKAGGNEYQEYIYFNIIDPFSIIYSDEWDNFRKNICLERPNTNTFTPTLYVSLYIVDNYNDSYILANDCSGGYTNFIISNNNDFLDLRLSSSVNPLGFKFDIHYNEVYDSFTEYIYETYALSTSYKNIAFDIIIKNKDSIIYDPCTVRTYNGVENYGKSVQYISINDLGNNLIKEFLSTWLNYEEGWSIVGSLTIYDDQYYLDGHNDLVVNENKNELLSFVSNEIPITQELFSLFANGGCEKIIDIEDMNIQTFNVVNKIEHNIVQVERPNVTESKNNIVQPVFFRVKESEILTLHPMVTENISINLDDYKSKVERFTLQIGDTLFSQIGANSYGILFKIKANTLPKTITAGTYYVLDENNELITTGKYNCVM
jgi:hypothetical protein